MKKGGWIAIDKRFINLLPKDDRPFTILEAMFSYSVDRDNKHSGSINGYATLWNWSRDKVRRFIHMIENGDDYPTGKKTGKKTGNHTSIKQAIRYVFNKLDNTKNSDTDRQSYKQDDTTIDPYDPISLNPKEYKGIFPKDKKFSSPLSFENFIKEKIQKNPEEDVDMKKIKTIAYFLDMFQATQRDQHPRLRPEQWQEAINDIFNVELEYNQSDEISYEACMTIIDKYFQKQYAPGCTYFLMHFLSSGVKKNLYYEELS